MTYVVPAGPGSRYMRPAPMLAAAMITAALTACGPSDSEREQSSAVAESASPPSTPHPYAPTVADMKAYKDTRLKITMALVQCKLSKTLIGNAIIQGDQLGAYQRAIEGKNGCQGLSSLDGMDFSAIQNGDLAAKLKDASQDCGLAMFVRSQAYDIIAKSINNDEARPSDVTDANSHFAQADEYTASCEAKMDTIGTAVGLENAQLPSAQGASSAPPSAAAVPAPITAGGSTEQTSRAVEKAPLDDQPAHSDAYVCAHGDPNSEITVSACDRKDLPAIDAQNR